VPAKLREKEPAVPWRNIAAMRDLLIHRYFRIDMNRVWDVVENDLASLESAVQRLLASSELADE